VKPADLEAMFRAKPPQYWNVLDADARKGKLTAFTAPTVMRQISLVRVADRLPLKHR
jgi:hypothetical protein